MSIRLPQKIVSVGTLDDTELAIAFMRYLWKYSRDYRRMLPGESVEDYLDYLFVKMEELTPKFRYYFGTPSDDRPDVFGYFKLPDTRRQ